MTRPRLPAPAGAGERVRHAFGARTAAGTTAAWRLNRSHP
ncbi:hypothetical protein OH687_37935 [Burkholderia anthina]|nr:hypothetical protein OH687_37935 [Burkholderia anthina]